MEPENSEAILTKIRSGLECGGLTEAVIEELAAMRPADRAEVFSELSAEEQQSLLPFLDLQSQAGLFEELAGEDAAALAQTLSSDNLADVLDEVSADTAADILGDMPSDQANSALLQMEDADEVADLLQYPDDTAGGLMNSDFVVFHPDVTAQEVIDKLRSNTFDANVPYYLYVTDKQNTLVGVVGLRALIVSDPDTPIGEFMDSRVISVLVDTDQEGVANLMKKYRLALLPVIDPANRLLGIIHAEDIVFVLEEEATEDILRLGGVSDSFLQVWSPISLSVRKRLPWLYINLLTAFLAASVVNLFEDTIAKFAVLAVFQGIIAGQGGNSATQTLTLIVRGLAMNELDVKDTWQVLGREVLIGIINGVAIGVAVGLGAWYWKGTPVLGVIVAIAMIGNMFAAAIGGTLVPLGLRAVKMDPALASAVIVTTITDCVGFGFFLWLASRWLF